MIQEIFVGGLTSSCVAFLWNTKFKKYGKDSRKSLKICYEDYESTYDILLKKGNHDMLYIGYLRNMATEIFKALHGSTPIYIRSF